MKIEDLKILNSEQGREMLERYESYRDDELENLMFKATDEDRVLLRATVSMIKMRHRAEVKFSQAGQMFFTPDGVEQSTGENISCLIAERFGKGKKIVDLTCSIGGNTVFFAKGNNVVAIDRNEANIFCAGRNAEVYGVRDQIKFVLGDAFENIIEDADAFFVDPERARMGRTKTRSVFNGSPDISVLLPRLLSVTANIGIKISPAFDYREIASLSIDPEIEVISENNVCKVTMLWFGDYKTCQRRATCLLNGRTYSYVNDNQPDSIEFVKNPLLYLYEPDKGIIKAHLIDEIAKRFSLYKLDPQVAYLTSDERVESDGVLRRFKIIDAGLFSIKEVQNKLKQNKIDRVNISTRHFPTEVEKLYKKIKIKEGGNFFLFFTTLSDRRYYILTEKDI